MVQSFEEFSSNKESINFFAISELFTVKSATSIEHRSISIGSSSACLTAHLIASINSSWKRAIIENAACIEFEAKFFVRSYSKKLKILSGNEAKARVNCNRLRSSVSPKNYFVYNAREKIQIKFLKV